MLKASRLELLAVDLYEAGVIDLFKGINGSNPMSLDGAGTDKIWLKAYDNPEHGGEDDTHGKLLAYVSGDATDENNWAELTPATFAEYIIENASAVYQPLDSDLTAIAALAKTDGNVIVGDGSTWVAESGATARTSLGVGTGDSPQFTGVELSHATANTLTGSSGDALIEGNRLFRVGGTDVPIADGGTGASTANAAIEALLNAGVTTTITSVDDEADYVYVRDATDSLLKRALGKNLGFTQAGTGATLRTLQTELRDAPVKFEQFGVVSGLAVADAVAEANVTNAQKALDYAETTGRAIHCPAQYYVFKAGGLRIPTSVHCYGEGVGYWEPVFPSRPKTWGGTSWIFKGTGPADVTITGITSMRYASGWREDPDNPGEYFKLFSFMNDDASGTTPATPKSLSVAVTGKGTAATDWGLHGIRVVPWIGSDGIDDYSDTGNAGLSDDWDIGVLLLDNEYVTLENGQSVGHWRVAGTAVLSPGFTSTGRSEQVLIRNWKTQGLRGLMIRAGDTWAVSATTATTVTIRWSEESYWPSGGGSFEGLGSSSPNYTYTSTTRVGSDLRFNGVSPDPTVAAIFLIRNVNSGSGFAHSQVEKAYVFGLDHESGNDSESFTLPISGCFEMSGHPMRGWHFQNFKTATTSERINSFLLDVDDAHFFDWQAEAIQSHLIATPATADQSWAAAPVSDTRNLRIYASASFDTSCRVDLFTPRSYLDDARQINPIDELDGNFVLRALDGQDFKIELATGQTWQVQDDGETALLTIDESTGDVLTGTTSSQTFGQSVVPRLQIHGLSSTNNTSIGLARWSNNANPGTLRLAKSRGATVGSHVVVQADDQLGQIVWEGSDGTAFIPAARVQGLVATTPGTNDMPGKLEFQTTPDGSATLATRFTLAQTGIDLAASHAISIAGTNIIVDAAGTATLSNIDALDATTEATIEAAIDTLTALTISSSAPILTLTDTDTGADSTVSGSSGAGSLFLMADSGNEVASSTMGFGLDGTNNIQLEAGGLRPVTGQTKALGSTTQGWNGLHLATTTAINWANGNATLTHASGLLTANVPIATTQLRTAMVGELTIATGAITITGGYHRVDTEADAASDDLATINGGVDGARLVLRAENTARTVVVKDGTGNIQCAGDFSLDNTQDTIELIYDGTLTAWLEIGRSDNGA
jgi:hypothetical protein